MLKYNFNTRSAQFEQKTDWCSVKCVRPSGEAAVVETIPDAEPAEPAAPAAKKEKAAPKAKAAAPENIPQTPAPRQTGAYTRSR